MVLKARRWWKKDTNSSYCQQDLSEPKSLAHSDLKDCKSSSSSSSTSARVTTSTRFCVGIFTHFFLGLQTWSSNELIISCSRVMERYQVPILGFHSSQPRPQQSADYFVLLVWALCLAWYRLRTPLRRFFFQFSLKWNGRPSAWPVLERSDVI